MSSPTAGYRWMPQKLGSIPIRRIISSGRTTTIACSLLSDETSGSTHLSRRSAQLLHLSLRAGRKAVRGGIQVLVPRPNQRWRLRRFPRCLPCLGGRLHLKCAPLTGRATTIRRSGRTRHFHSNHHATPGWLASPKLTAAHRASGVACESRKGVVTRSKSGPRKRDAVHRCPCSDFLERHLRTGIRSPSVDSSWWFQTHALYAFASWWTYGSPVDHGSVSVCATHDLGIAQSHSPARGKWTCRSSIVLCGRHVLLRTLRAGRK